MKRCITLMLFQICLLFANGQPSAQKGLPIRLQGNMKVLQREKGAWLIQQTIIQQKDTATLLIQLIDLRHNSVHQYYALSPNGGAGQGRYGPGPDASPFFYRIPFTSVIDALRPRGVWSIFNASFFEEYKDSTQLSFPLSAEGKLITAGSSRYGPAADAATPYYRSVKLLALVLQGDRCSITAYDESTGAPLGLRDARQVMVSYNYKDHPAHQFAPGSKNRFLLAGTLSARESHYLLFAATTGTTISTAAGLLRNLGVKSPVLSLDGGASVFLFQRQLGVLLQPASARNSEGLHIERLPHYLYVQSKGGNLPY